MVAKYLPADNPARIERDLQVVAEHISGKSQPTIASEMGLSPARVCQLLSKDAAKALIEQAIHHNISHLDDAVKVHDALLQSEDEQIRLKATQLRYQVTGVTPSHAQSIAIQQIFIGQNQVISADLASVLHDLLGSKHSLLDTQPAEQVQDCEIIDRK